MPNTLNKQQIDKLGNTLIYFANNVGDFGKTKALKLLFILEEKSIKKFGVPFFGFDFKVWQYGPVVEEVYNELDKKEIPLLSAYITRSPFNNDEFDAVTEFNDDEFSDNDIHLLEETINFSRHKTAKDLVKFTHGEGSLWKKSVDENNLSNKFASKQISTTNIVIDFSSLLKENEFLQERYQDSLDYIKFNSYLKS